MKILLTGATGFVGTGLLLRLQADKSVQIRAAGRAPKGVLPSGVGSVVVGDLGPETDWRQAVTGVDVVIHLAARVHVMRDAADGKLG
ncbi:MAG: hypothetical protein RL077_5837 [Verrucomicrobiota bacterium]|jgi:nucleoside-diphosphate-sugar epimerase